MRTNAIIIALLLSLTILSVSPSTISLLPSLPKAHAVGTTSTTKWLPYGPFADNVLITVYSDFATMFTHFTSGDVDITDWNIQPADLSCTANPSCFPNNPDFALTGSIDEFGIFEVDINHHASALGVAQQQASNVTGSDSNTMTTDHGIQLRQALAHMVDKPDFQNVAALGGAAKYVDIQAPPAQGLQPFGSTQSSQFQGSAAAQAEIDKDLAYVKSISATPADYAGVTHDVSAYNLVADSIGGGSLTWGHAFADHGYSGKLDLQAACDLLVKAGAGTVTPAGSTCHDVLASYPAVGTAHLVAPATINIVIRTHAPRKAYGSIIADSVNYLYGTPGDAGGTVIYGPLGTFTPQYYTISQISGVVFSTKTADDWNLYTAGWSLGSTPDQLYSLYYSQFATSACGGKKSDFAQDYVFWCDPAYDVAAKAGEFSATLPAAATNFVTAAVIAHEKVMTIPVYSAAGERFAALNGWDGLVSVLGHGFQTGYNSLLNMRCTPGYTPTNPIYTPGGGNCGTIRRGFSQDVHKLSPFQATTVWDFEVLSQVYESMLFVNPQTGGVGQQIIDWMTTKHTSNFNPTGCGISGGCTTQQWNLRNDLKFQDGSALTADDVVFSILSYRDVPSANFQPSVATVINAVALDAHTVQVQLKGQSAFYELNIGGLPIIPKAKWAPLCPTTCADPAFDPMAAGIYIGSGPYMCLNINTGAVGGSCTQTAAGAISGQEVTLGGRILLTRYDGYMRASPNAIGVKNTATGVSADSSLDKLSWSDKNDDGAVNILDVASAALAFGVNDPYWDHPVIGVATNIVDIGEIATIAFYFDHGVTTPFAPSALISMDTDPSTGSPMTDPYEVGTPVRPAGLLLIPGGPEWASVQFFVVRGAEAAGPATVCMSPYQSALAWPLRVPAGNNCAVPAPFHHNPHFVNGPNALACAGVAAADANYCESQAVAPNGRSLYAFNNISEQAGVPAAEHLFIRVTNGPADLAFGPNVRYWFTFALV